jgi:hypothetical protein
MKLVLRSLVQAEEDEEDLVATAASCESAVWETKGCRNFRQPFFVMPQYQTFP